MNRSCSAAMKRLRSCGSEVIRDTNRYFKTMPSSLIQTKSFEEEVLTETKLDRCLNVFDLTFLGIGSTLGLGIYVLAGTVASTEAGPAVIISFLIAAIASVFAGLCYAEFGARVPRAGSAYVYSYVTVGEFIAFIIGWNLILEYAIGTASVARGYSGYIDSLAGHVIENYFNSTMHIDAGHMAQYPDFLAFGITMLLAGVLSIGVSESSKFNNVFTIVNLLIVTYVIICGLFKADIHNWQLKPSEIPPGKHGDGGFFPFGIGGMLTGASTCFYGFVGFDCIATTGEEVRNPRRSIPIAIVTSLIVVFLAYFGVSTVSTLMVPYWQQDSSAPLPDIFELVGWKSAKYVISVGALAGLSTSLLGGMFPLPRVLYAMASDGLIFRFLARIHPRSKTPVIATAFSGLLTATLALLFNVEELAKMMSIGTLLAYTLVATSVLVLRYRDEDPSVNEKSDDELHNPNMEIKVNSLSIVHTFSARNFVYQIFNRDKLVKPTPLSSKVAVYFIAIIGILITSLDVILAFYFDKVRSLDIVTVTALVIILALLFIAIGVLFLQPMENREISFKVPFVPFTPILSIFINIFLMMKLPIQTWERFGVWMAIGFLIYFGYGIRNSSQRIPQYSLPSEQMHNSEYTEDTPILG